jgi:cell wall assembly regulator SMI1
VAWAPKALLGEPAVNTDPSGLKPLLDRLEKWLKRRRRRYYKGLLPGASDADLAKLEKALRRPVPPGLAEWLRWHNGQDEEVIGAFVESFRLMSADEIIEALKQHKRDKGWNTAWVPILQDDSDDLVVLDTSKDELPVREIWQGRDDVIEAGPSLEAWLTNLLDDFEAGRYHEDPERGDFIRGSDA